MEHNSHNNILSSSLAFTEGEGRGEDVRAEDVFMDPSTHKDILSSSLAFLEGEGRGEDVRADDARGGLIALARKNRKKATEAESVMWEILRGSFCGVRFRRQHVIAGYIADFACTSKKLIVEIDGGYHFSDEQQKEDAYRTEVLNGYGYTVMRFTNEEVLATPDLVIKRLKNYIIKELI